MSDYALMDNIFQMRERINEQGAVINRQAETISDLILQREALALALEDVLGLVGHERLNTDELETIHKAKALL